MIFDLLAVLSFVCTEPPLIKEVSAPSPALIANPPITLVQRAENGRLLRWPEPSHIAVQKLNLAPEIRQRVQYFILDRDKEFDLYVDENLDRLKEMVLKSSQGGEVSLGEAIDGWGVVSKRSSLVYELKDLITPEQAKIALDAVRSYRTVLEEEVAADAGVELPPRALKIRATMATRSVRLRESPRAAQSSHCCESTSEAGSHPSPAATHDAAVDAIANRPRRAECDAGAGSRFGVCRPVQRRTSF